MTLSEAKDILVTRIGWRDDKTVPSFTLSAANLTSDSGRVFQGEHSAVTLQNVRDCQPIDSIIEADFNTYLEDVREQIVIQVLSDVFEKDFINDKLFDFFPTGFDNLISLRMVIWVSELIMSSVRSNRIERITDEFLGKLNYDIFRDPPSSGGAKYNTSATVRYGSEVVSAQRRFGSQRNLLKTITKGQVFNPYIDELSKSQRDWFRCGNTAHSN